MKLRPDRPLRRLYGVSIGSWNHLVRYGDRTRHWELVCEPSERRARVANALGWPKRCHCLRQLCVRWRGAAGRKSSDAGDRPLSADLAHRLRTNDLIVDDVVDFESAGITVAHQHVAGAESTHRAKANHLPFQSDLAHRSSKCNLVIGDII